MFFDDDDDDMGWRFTYLPLTTNVQYVLRSVGVCHVLCSNITDTLCIRRIYRKKRNKKLNQSINQSVHSVGDG